MKQLFTLIICAFLFSNTVHSQTVSPIAVPVFMESAKIDSLMGMIFHKDSPWAGTLAVDSQDSCWRVELRDMKAYISFQIVKSSKPVMNLLFNKLINRNAKIGCFEYKGNKIFAWLVDKDPGFFSQTKETKTIPFIYKIDDSSPLPKDRLFGVVFHFKFEQGVFSIEGPPPVQ